MGGRDVKKFFNLFIVVTFIISITNFAYAEQNYNLEKVLILSRHNLRAPLVTKNSQLNQKYNEINVENKKSKENIGELNKNI